MAYKKPSKFFIKNSTFFFSTGFLTQIQALENEQCSICYLLTLQYFYSCTMVGDLLTFGIRSSSPFSRHFANALVLCVGGA